MGCRFFSVLDAAQKLKYLNRTKKNHFFLAYIKKL